MDPTQPMQVVHVPMWWVWPLGLLDHYSLSLPATLGNSRQHHSNQQQKPIFSPKRKEKAQKFSTYW